MIAIVAWVLVALSFLSARALAAVDFVNTEFYIHEREPFTIRWTGNRGPVSLALMRGPDEDLSRVLDIVTDYAGDEYTWTPPASLRSGSYVIRLQDAGSTSYSPRFQYPAPPEESTATPSAESTSPLPSPSHSPSTTSSPDSSSVPVFSTPAIATAATLGGLLFLVLLGIVVYCVSRRRRRGREAVNNKAEYGAVAAEQEEGATRPGSSHWGSGVNQSRTAVGVGVGEDARMPMPMSMAVQPTGGGDGNAATAAAAATGHFGAGTGAGGDHYYAQQPLATPPFPPSSETATLAVGSSHGASPAHFSTTPEGGDSGKEGIYWGGVGLGQGQGWGRSELPARGPGETPELSAQGKYLQ
ncbi:hypothetical protein C7999DRAFT_33068 [Corynascus novoguineensis]|uniref:Yeast cell wall synthesis Kre9/Knh1-like N-terminal domain-containing protein n=1 Tax=Corynascus novoguineensis TaxID=1126955 RepID=A0AAN7CR80_9PEZI|nr:hypothetical protein C7999DRAFT_33068 [Corynascus novoguineensis]